MSVYVTDLTPPTHCPVCNGPMSAEWESTADARTRLLETKLREARRLIATLGEAHERAIALLVDARPKP